MFLLALLERSDLRRGDDRGQGQRAEVAREGKCMASAVFYTHIPRLARVSLVQVWRAV